MAVSNMLVYDGKLVCGNTQVANRCLNVDSSPLQVMWNIGVDGLRTLMMVIVVVIQMIMGPVQPHSC